MARPPSASVRDLTIKGLGFFTSLVVMFLAIACLVAGLTGAISHPDLITRTIFSPAMLTGYGRERRVWLVLLSGLNLCFVLFVAGIAWLGGGAEWRHTREGPKELLTRLAIVWIGLNALLEIAHVAMGWATALSVAFAAQASHDNPTRWHVVLATMAGGGVLIDVVYIAIIAFGVGVLLAHLVTSWSTGK